MCAESASTRKSQADTLVDLLRAMAETRPDSRAYVFLGQDGSETGSLTYGELDRKARAIAIRLESFSASEEPILLLCPPGLDYLAGFLGILYAGGIAIPAYPPALGKTLAHVQSIVRDAKPRLALTVSAVAQKLAAKFSGIPEISGLERICTDSIGDESDAAAWSEPQIESGSLALLQYTSGSTANPRGVMVSHANLLHNEGLIQQAFQQTENSVIVSWLPPYHDMGLIGGLIQPLYTGALCVLMPPSSFLQRPVKWLRAISDYKATTSGGPNFAYEYCVRKISETEKAGLDLSTWTTAFNGAEPVRVETLDRFGAAFAGCGFRREAFFPCYGLAEATLFVTGGEIDRHSRLLKVQSDSLKHNKVKVTEQSHPGSISLISSGRSFGAQIVQIVNPETLKLCDSDQVGEIWISGSSVAAGYWGGGEESEKTFCATLAGMEGVNFLRTGDLGFLHENELYVCGRLKEMMILRGRNYYPQDIEHTVRGCGPDLSVAAAFSVDVDGEERLVVVQEYEGRERDLNAEELFSSMQSAVAEYHEVRLYTAAIVRTGSVPRTTSGKIQRYKCRSLFLRQELGSLAIRVWEEPSLNNPDASAFSSTAHEVSMHSLSEFLRNYIAQVLEVPAAEIDTEVPISRLGLDSLHIASLVNKIEQKFNILLDRVSIMDRYSIVTLAAQLEECLISTPPSSAEVTELESQSEQQGLSWEQERL